MKEGKNYVPYLLEPEEYRKRKDRRTEILRVMSRSKGTGGSGSYIQRIVDGMRDSGAGI